MASLEGCFSGVTDFKYFTGEVISMDIIFGMIEIILFLWLLVYVGRIKFYLQQLYESKNKKE